MLYGAELLIGNLFMNLKKRKNILIIKNSPITLSAPPAIPLIKIGNAKLLAYSFNKVKQGGKLIFLCSDDPDEKDRTLPKFKNAETLKYPDWMKDIKFPGGGFYAPANKYYSMKKWVETYPNLKDNQTVLFLDPDMVFINPIKIDIKKGELWGQNWYSEDGSREIFDKFTNKNRNLINDNFCFMYPIAMTIHDVKLIVDTYINKCNQILKSEKIWNLRCMALLSQLQKQD